MLELPNVQMPKIGDQLGYYVLQSVLGEGVQAKVFLAQNTLLKRLTALKVFKRAPETDHHILREARTIAALEHSNIVRVFQMECVGRLWFLATEYINGGSVADRLARGPLPLPDLLAFAQDAASALSYAHTHKVLHNDLKPQNFLISTPSCAESTGRDTLKLADFGLASDEGGAEFVGTPLYMAPEIWMRQGPSQSSDLYSLGACLYHMAVGRPPFMPASSDLLRKAHLEQAPKIPTSLPGYFRYILKCLLEKRPEDRPKDARFVLEQISPNGDSPVLDLPVLATQRRETTSWLLKTLDEKGEDLSIYTNFKEELSTLLAAAPRLLIVKCRYPQMVSSVVRQALESTPSMPLVGRCLVSSDPIEQSRRLEEVSHAARADGVIHVHLERALNPIESERLMCLAEDAASARRTYLITGSDSMLSSFFEHVRASGREGAARLVDFGVPNDELLTLLMKSAASVANLCAFSVAARKRCIEFEQQTPEDFELLLHNAIALTRLTGQHFVTTWAIEGALAHSQHIDSMSDISPDWVVPPQMWPPIKEPPVPPEPTPVPIQSSAALGSNPSRGRRPIRIQSRGRRDPFCDSFVEFDEDKTLME